MWNTHNERPCQKPPLWLKLWYSFKSAIVFVLLSLPYIIAVSNNIISTVVPQYILSSVGVDVVSTITRGVLYMLAVFLMMLS